MTQRPVDTQSDDEDLPLMGGGISSPKLQRWVDLLAALLSRHLPATFDELARDVPEYWFKRQAIEALSDERRRKTAVDSLKRTFERDKDELRAFGVPIESQDDADGNSHGAYRLRRTDFYLPYLCFAVPGGEVTQPRRLDKWGYAALTALTFDADELQAVADAAAGVRSLGDPLLAADAESALRKLAVDLPVDSAIAAPDAPRVVLGRARASAAVFDALGDALRRRKSVTFEYHAMSTDLTETREVEPYGLFFLSAHWYLAARDVKRNELRNFRLSRITRVKVNGAKPQTPDFEVPASFHLREHARMRHPWELGDGDAARAVVAFLGTSGPSMAALKLGEPVEEFADRRAFDVRRPDAFVRWLLSFAGELVPIEPASLVHAYRQAVAETATIYDAVLDLDAESAPLPPPGEPTDAVRAAAPAPVTRQSSTTPSPTGRHAWQPTGAAAQLRRILHVVPQIADGEEHDLATVAHHVGTSVEVLQRDLFSLVSRFDTPGGFVEGVQLFVEADRVSAHSNHLQRPMRLTVSELCALELGLAVLRATRPPDEYAALDRARERLRQVLSRLPGDPLPDGTLGATLVASLGHPGNTLHLAEVRTALRERRRLRLVYRKSGSVSAGERVVCPYALLASNGMLYIIAHCDRESGVRVFRMDRVEDAAATSEVFAPPTDFSVETLLRDGRVFSAERPEVMRVRYSPRVARWIAEREGIAVRTDGSLEMEHPLADAEWGVRHVLQYGPDAEALAPTGLRRALRDRLAAMAETVTGH